MALRASLAATGSSVAGTFGHARRGRGWRRKGAVDAGRVLKVAINQRNQLLQQRFRDVRVVEDLHGSVLRVTASHWW